MIALTSITGMGGNVICGVSNAGTATKYKVAVAFPARSQSEAKASKDPGERPKKMSSSPQQRDSKMDESQKENRDRRKQRHACESQRTHDRSRKGQRNHRDAATKVSTFPGPHRFNQGSKKRRLMAYPNLPSLGSHRDIPFRTRKKRQDGQ